MVGITPSIFSVLQKSSKNGIYSSDLILGAKTFSSQKESAGAVKSASVP